VKELRFPPPPHPSEARKKIFDHFCQDNIFRTLFAQAEALLTQKLSRFKENFNNSH
jgi:hypothetical protein